MEVLISKEDTKKKVRQLGTDEQASVSIILGAGASFGYSLENNNRPPIVKDLFDSSNPIVYKVISKPEHAFIRNNSADFIEELKNYDNDLEKYLSFIFSRNSEDNLFGNFLAYLEDIFFFASEDVARESNNYKKLINLMWDLHGKKHWSCLSFNYDTLLEKSYLIAGRDTTGRSFGSIESYLNHSPAILKIHGGVNHRYIFRKFYEDNDSGFHNNHRLFSMMMNERKSYQEFLSILDLDSSKPDRFKLESVRDEEKKKWRNVSRLNFPLMLIPIHATITPENIFFKNLLDLAGKEIEKASLVIAIGYNFGDEAFIDILKKVDLSKKEIILVNTQRTVNNLDQNLGYQRIKKIWPETNVKIFDGDGFQGFIDAIR